MALFRYPGGKSKLKKEILAKLSKHQNDLVEYREPFFGGGSIGLEFIRTNNALKKFWINDYDVGISCLWTSVKNYPDELKKLVKEFQPSIKNFFLFKKDLINSNSPSSDEETISLGFKKIAIHQISYSGLGTKSGSPLGGMEQKSQYKIDCRWSPTNICKNIDKYHILLSRTELKHNKCTSLDFEDLIKDETTKSLIYLDPPYYIKGNDLYQCGFSNDDHIRLSVALKNTSHSWVLSYDDCLEIRELYSWAAIDEINVNYTITGARAKKELIITK